MPLYRRTEAEFRKPFENKTSKVYEAGLRLIECETYSPCIGTEFVLSLEEKSMLLQNMLVL